MKADLEEWELEIGEVIAYTDSIRIEEGHRLVYLYVVGDCVHVCLGSDTSV